jgi:hypothetical protein
MKYINNGLIHPSMLIFVGELGCNTNKKQQSDKQEMP